MSLRIIIWGIAWRVATTVVVFAALYEGGRRFQQALYDPSHPDLHWGLSVYHTTWLLAGLGLLASAGRQLARWPALPLGLPLGAAYLLGVGLLSGFWTGHLPHPWRLLLLLGCGLAALAAPLLFEWLIRRRSSNF